MGNKLFGHILIQLCALIKILKTWKQVLFINTAAKKKLAIQKSPTF